MHVVPLDVSDSPRYAAKLVIEGNQEKIDFFYRVLISFKEHTLVAT